MIFEYALEPELAASWHDFKDARYFKEKFGIRRGRLVSRYPKRWKALVWQAFDSSDQNARKRLEGLVTVLTRNMVVRGSSFDGSRPSWLENAENEHERSPFHAILARANPRNNPAVVLGHRLDEESEPRWVVHQSVPAPRDAEQLAEVVAPMLRCASKAIFVDPNFKPEEQRFCRTLGAFLAAMLRGRPGPMPYVELQVDQDKYGRKHFEQHCQKKLPAIVPVGLKLYIVRWKQRCGGQPLHNRYILTDIGAVLFGHGLDESGERVDRTASEAKAPGNQCGSTDDIVHLSEKTYLHRWRQYASDTPAFDREELPLVIDGKAKIQGKGGAT